MRRRGCSPRAGVARKRRRVGVLDARRVVKAGFAVAAVRKERRRREAILVGCFVGFEVLCTLVLSGRRD